MMFCHLRQFFLGYLFLKKPNVFITKFCKKVEIVKVKTIFLQAKLSSHKTFCPQGVLVDFTFEHVIAP